MARSLFCANYASRRQRRHITHKVTGDKDHKGHEKSPWGQAPFIYIHTQQGLKQVSIQSYTAEEMKPKARAKFQAPNNYTAGTRKHALIPHTHLPADSPAKKVHFISVPTTSARLLAAEATLQIYNHHPEHNEEGALQ